MPQYDYVSRRKKGSKRSLIMAAIIFLCFAFGGGLWLIKENSPAPVLPQPSATDATSNSGISLPNRPEETYSYIRNLEQREVPFDAKSKSQQDKLNAEQARKLKEKLEEEARLAAGVKPNENTESNVAETKETVIETAKNIEPAKTDEQKLAKIAEEKRKQQELKKQQEQAKKAETKTEPATKTETAKTPEKAKTDKKPEVVNAQTPTVGKFGLQCGAFKNKAQAENMQARLAMAGYNARISSSADWNRVFVGPVGDRNAAVSAQSNARSVAECVIISM